MIDESTFIEQTLETLAQAKRNARRDPKTSEIGALLGLLAVRGRYGVPYRTVELAESALQRRASQIDEETAIVAVMAVLADAR